MIKQLAVIGLMAGALAVSGPAAAQWYIGGGGGVSKADIDTTGLNSTIRSVPGITGVATTADERDTAFKLYGGYQFHPNFAGEISYANLGKFTTTSTTTPPATFTGEIKVQNTWSFDLVGIVPLQNNFSIFGKVGLLYAETKASFSGVGPGGNAGVSNKEDDWSWKAGLGVGYEFNNQVGLRGEWERYRVPDGFGGSKSDVDLFSLSVRFKF